ncbi:MAG: UDP-N-acetylmuramate dehydrogenase [Streptosporangiaceae bacterium]
MVGERVALSAYTTLGLGGPAGRFVAAGDDEQVITAVRQADRAGAPVLILGGGSNLVVADEGFPGTVIQVASRGIIVDDGPPGVDDAPGAGGEDGESVLVTVAAGEAWDLLVAWSVAEGLAGLECLSGIPGLAGATPIQNVGAYGQDVSETITEVRAFDRERDEVIRLSRADCEFGYRTSMLKRAAAGLATGRFVVLSVTFRLARAEASRPGRAEADRPVRAEADRLGRRAEAEPDVAGQAADPGPSRGLSRPVRYAELARTLGVEVGGRVPLDEARSAVLALRRGKGMVLEAGDPDTRSAGSFFTNPIVSAAQFEELGRRAAERLGSQAPVPHFPADEAPPDGGPAEGAVKVPAAWLIERAGFTKGYPAHGAARISTKHTLALTNHGEATTADLLALAREIRAGVRAQFGINLSNEPVLVGVAL